MSGNHSNNVGDIVTPQTNDVLSGRGRGVMLNAGNRLLHDVVDRNRERYQNAKKMAKKEIVIEAIEEVRSHGSRFLQKDKNGQHSIASESWVRDKVGHLFRERKRTKPSKLGSYDGAVETSQQQGDSPENILNGTVPNGSTNNSNSKSKPGFGFEFLKRKSLTLRSSFKLRRDSLRRDSFKMNPSPSHNDDVGDQEEDSKSFKTTLLQKQKLIFSMLSTKDKTNAAVEEEERSKNTNSTDLSSTPDYHPQYSQGETTLVTQQDPMAYNSNNATKEPSYSEDDATYNASVPPSLNPQPPYNPTSGTPPPIPTPMGATGLLSNSNLVHRVSDKLGAGSSSTSLPTTTTTTTTSSTVNTRQSVTMADALPAPSKDIFSYANLISEDDGSTTATPSSNPPPLESRKSMTMAEIAEVLLRYNVIVEDEPTTTPPAPPLNSRQSITMAEIAEVLLNDGQDDDTSEDDPTKTATTTAPPLLINRQSMTMAEIAEVLMNHRDNATFSEDEPTTPTAPSRLNNRQSMTMTEIAEAIHRDISTAKPSRQSVTMTDAEVQDFIDNDLDNIPFSLSAVSTPRQSTATARQSGVSAGDMNLDRLSLSMSEVGLEDIFERNADTTTPRHSLSASSTAISRFSIDNRTSLKILDDKFQDLIENGAEEDQ